MANFALIQGQANAVYSLPHLYISGLNFNAASPSVVGTNIVAIAAGQARDMNDVLDMPVSWPNANNQIYPPILYQDFQQPILINAAVNGINGLDIGSLRATTQYAIYLVGDSHGNNPVGGIVTIHSNVFPVLPIGYDSVRLLGFLQTNSSSLFVTSNLTQPISGGVTYNYSPAFNILSNGNATSYTGIDLASAVPTNGLSNVILYLYVQFTPALAGDIVNLVATGSETNTPNPVQIVGVAPNVMQSQYVQVVGGVNGSTHCSINYKVTSSSDSVNISVAAFTAIPFVSIPT